MTIYTTKCEQLGKELLRRYNVRVRKYVRGRRGRAFIKEREINAPHPYNRRALIVFAKYIGYVVNGKQEYEFYAEYLAQRWAIKCVRKLGLHVPDDYWPKARTLVYEKLLEEYMTGRVKAIPVEVLYWIRTVRTFKFPSGKSRKLRTKRLRHFPGRHKKGRPSKEELMKLLQLC